ncbi:MAG: hypothetical protein BWX45_00634 [Deltaproteobacteria bacterium ADurb.Bin002]|nr:MAG: hypothetical protein BWX45_00634 [Deltaproteobacteria bacterium ADurb.Bin002]
MAARFSPSCPGNDSHCFTRFRLGLGVRCSGQYSAAGRDVADVHSVSEVYRRKKTPASQLHHPDPAVSRSGLFYLHPAESVGENFQFLRRCADFHISSRLERTVPRALRPAPSDAGNRSCLQPGMPHQHRSHDRLSDQHPASHRFFSIRLRQRFVFHRLSDTLDSPGLQPDTDVQQTSALEHREAGGEILQDLLPVSQRHQPDQTVRWRNSGSQ